MNIKYIEDYYDKIKEQFPELETWEIEKILKHGMQSLYTLNNHGADVLIKSKHTPVVLYFGKLFFNKEIAARYYNLKWKIKLRINYLHNKTMWDGYYYFGLSEDDYHKYIPNKKGRIKNKILFKDLYACKIKEESFLYTSCKYFFRVKLEKEGKMTIHLKDFSTRNIDLIAKRDNKGKIHYINE